MPGFHSYLKRFGTSLPPLSYCRESPANQCAAEETKECNKPACSTDGGYTPWGEWGKCSVTCGYGVMTRTRTCTKPPPAGNGKDCSGLGPATETKECSKTLCPSPCRLPKIFDLGVVIDSSGSIGADNFKLIRSFLSKLFAQYDVGPSHTRIGIMQYNESPKYYGITPLSTTHQNLAYLQGFAANMKFLKGKTRTDLGMLLGFNKFFKNNNDRKYPNVMIVMTDGNTNPGSIPFSKVLEEFPSHKVRVIAVGVGKDIDNGELREIAMGDAKHVIHIDNFSDLIKNMDELLDKACKD